VLNIIFNSYLITTIYLAIVFINILFKVSLVIYFSFFYLIY